MNRPLASITLVSLLLTTSSPDLAGGQGMETSIINNEIDLPAPALRDYAAGLRKAAAGALAIRTFIGLYINYRIDIAPDVVMKWADSDFVSFVRGLGTIAESPLWVATLKSSALPRRGPLSDDDLQLLGDLVDRLRSASKRAETEMIQLTTRSQDILNPYSHLDRYALLNVLSRTHRDWPGLQTQTGIRTLLASTGLDYPIGTYPTRAFHPYAFLLAVPREGEEAAALRGGLAGFLNRLRDFHRQFTDPERVTEGIALYQNARNTRVRGPDFRRPLAVPNPPAYNQADVKPSKIRLAFMDSGVDYLRFPSLAQHFAQGSAADPQSPRPRDLESRDLLRDLKSYDYSDDDPDPWSPYEVQEQKTYLSHGSGVVLTAQRVLKDQDQYQMDRVEMSMWKVYTDKSLLLGLADSWIPYFEVVPDTYVDAVLDQANQASEQPQVLSVSMQNIEVNRGLEQRGRRADLEKVQWLWVMAAGNHGSRLKIGDPNCLLDLPQADRKAQSVLCVGVVDRDLKKIVTDSNYGPLVDLYTFESYVSECPGKTSCGTPAIAAVAGRLMADFPNLGRQGTREVLLRASKKISIYSEKEGQSHVVGFFDPTSPDHIERALLEAAQWQK